MARSISRLEAARLLAEALESGNQTKLQLALVQAGLVSDVGEAGDILRPYDLRQKPVSQATDTKTR